MNTNLKYILPFHTAAWHLNGHFHTIGPSLLPNSGKPEHQRIEIPTPDDDFLELDVCTIQNSLAVVTLFHGLEGSTDRYYISRLMRVLAENGYSVVAVNFRSCGSRMNLRKRFYHSGETEDYATVFKWIGQAFPDQKMGAAGFSLGGNALLKSLGELQGDHPVDVAVAVSVPYDLALGSKSISMGFNRIYEYRFLRTLRKKLNEKRRIHPDLPVFAGNTLFGFDDQVTSKIHGFKDAGDYYESCSSKHFVSFIQKPALLIHSSQDPICPVSTMPMDDIQKNPSLNYIVTPQGGHVGFWSKPSGWLDQTVLNFFDQNFDL